MGEESHPQKNSVRFCDFLPLSVISRARARGEAGFVNLNLKVVILIRVVGRGGGKGERVVDLGIRNATGNGAGNVVTPVENLTPALRGNHLQPNVPALYLIHGRHALEEVLVIKRLEASRVIHSQRIDAVKGDARLSQIGGQSHNGVEDRVLVFLAQS